MHNYNIMHARIIRLRLNNLQRLDLLSTGSSPEFVEGTSSTSLQAISKKHLTPNGPAESGIAGLFKMLTYSHVCCAFSSARALSLNVICIFEMAWKLFPFIFLKFETLSLGVMKNRWCWVFSNMTDL